MTGVEAPAAPVDDEARRAERILLVDDDVELCELLAEYLSKEGYRISSAHDGVSGLRAALEGAHGLVILDVMLPRVSGFEVLRQVRRRSRVPVIMLTARAEEQDRVAGLGEGADDYLVKPFAASELLARIRAVMRRAFQAPVVPISIVELGELRLNSQTHAASVGHRPLELTPTEFAILEALTRAAGRLVSRDELAAVLYQRDATPFERSLDVHISHLRKKLEAAGGILIRTVRGHGYTLTAG